MKTRCVTNVLKKLVFPLAVGCCLLAGSASRAQDIIGIYSTMAGSEIISAGTPVDIRIRLRSEDGYFGREWLGGALDPVIAWEISRPHIRVMTGAGDAYAKLLSMDNNPPGFTHMYTTELVFEYIVRPGDLALPMRLFGSAGTTAPGLGLEIHDGQWRLYNVGSNANVVWQFTGDGLFLMTGAMDPTFEAANVRLKTIDFSALPETFVVQQGKSITGTITSLSPVTNDIPFYVWAGDTNIARVAGQAGTPVQLKLTPSQSSVDFTILGVTVGVTNIYLSPNATLDMSRTNYIARRVEVTPPPAPTVSVLIPGMVADAGGVVTLMESDISPVYATVTLSQPHPVPVSIRLDTTPVGQGNVEFDVSPKYVTIDANSLSSDPVAFTAKDGTQFGASVQIVPQIEDAYTNVFTRQESAKLKVLNVAPVFATPAPNVTFYATKQVSCDFAWALSDVAADTNTVSVTWVWNDLSGAGGQTVTNGAIGTVGHIFSSVGVFNVTVTATDKDNGTTSVSFFVNVSDGVPVPTIQVELVPDPNVASYDETNLTRHAKFVLSETFHTNMWVALQVGYPDVAISNAVFYLTDPIPIWQRELESGVFDFDIIDGTKLSGQTGITLLPVLVDSPGANAYFEKRPKTIKIQNIPPQITSILGKAPDAYLHVPANVPATVPYAFTAQIKDVSADIDTAWVVFDFGDGTDLQSNLVVRAGDESARGTVVHTYADGGFRKLSEGQDFPVRVWAVDKDGGRSIIHDFFVRVGPPPLVSVLPPSAGILSEKGDPIYPDEIMVQLSSAFTQQVTVALSVTPPNDNWTGRLLLDTNIVIFPPNSTEPRRVSIKNDRDGTIQSLTSGFTITPTVLSTPAALDYFRTNEFAQAGRVYIRNQAPEILSPSSTNSTAIAFTIPQGTPYTFYWNVNDVAQDLEGTNMVVEWIFNNGVVQRRTGRTGSIEHEFNNTGTATIEMTAIDKDEGRSTVRFTISVLPAKKVHVTPIGPVIAGPYASAAGLGNGLIFSDEARARVIETDVYSFTYDPGAVSATIRAIPYKTALGADASYRLTNYINKVTGLPGVDAIGTPGQTNALDSFVYIWVGGQDSGLPETALASIAEPVVVVSLPQAAGGGTGTSQDVAIRSVQAVFSREWRPLDNRGDINADGIPDIVANRYKLPELLGNDLTSVASYNGDVDEAASGNGGGQSGGGDFLPGVMTTSDPLITGPTNTYATVGAPFIALWEVRGFHPGLNDFEVGRTPEGGPTDGPLDEPGATLLKGGGTDPTKSDTDGDGYPDGWEYYFWYHSRIYDKKGSEYDPYNIAQGVEIPSSTIVQSFDPLVANMDYGRDTDNDGLTDIEELTMGLNPIHWDTDGDGMCDGWEVLRGLDPSVPDGHLNPDGDYMAYAEVDRQFVTVIDGDDVITTYLATNAAVGEVTGGFTLWWHYGDDNAPIAVGRAVEAAEVFTNGARVVEVEDIKAILIHNQVYQEFGFDPRVAWGETVNTLGNPNRFPQWVAGLTAETILTAPHTKRFTSLDEYLLLKYMSELRLNGATEAMGAGGTGSKIAAWLAYSTHPKTPDSDVVWNDNNEVVKTDRMPDGWELYVSTPKGYLELGLMVISPWDAYDGDVDIVMPGETESLSNMREFHGTDCSTFYTNKVLYAMTEERKEIVTILRPEIDAGWINKFWPTDPYNPDTDGDGVSDLAERTFLYGQDGAELAVDNGTVCTPGGGLNPNAMDTDLDGLPDPWEVAFRSTEQPVTPMAVTNGMDGTVNDAALDYDNDGLLNYQEYWVQAVRSFRYDIPLMDLTADESRTTMALTGQPMDTNFVPSVFFTEVRNGVRPGSEGWDVSRYPGGSVGTPLHVMLPVGNAKLYVSTDPRDPDTDADGMDDFYEMFHGLNPILGDDAQSRGDRIRQAYVKNGAATITHLLNDWSPLPLPMDFVNYPWLAGLDEADPDVDGLRNMEEHLQADTAAPFMYNTDPSPLWMTDIYSPASVTLRFYSPYGSTHAGTPMWFWPAGSVPVASVVSMYSFEMNEGYDTDNDGVSDKDELLLTATAQSDPQDHDDPMRRQALWFSGMNSSAQSFPQYVHKADSLRSFTVELWFCPENLPAGSGLLPNEQVLLERVLEYLPSDLSTPGYVVRANFRIGIDEQGCVYGLFQNAGVHDDFTGKSIVRSMPGRLTLNKWTHVILRMDGQSGTLELWLDGQIETSADTTLIPANGVYNFLQNPTGPQYPDENSLTYAPGLIVLGASNVIMPFPPLPEDAEWIHYSKFFTGYIDEVRIWDGARSNQQLLDNYKKRFTRVDLLANRSAVRKSAASGGLRVAGYTPQLPAELLYHYTFDNLFGADQAATIAKVPRGFNHNDRVMNRPTGYLSGLWDAMPLKSTVYSDYGYIPWIENGVEHLPWDGFETIGTNSIYREVFSVANSRYWRHYAVGGGSTNEIPSAHGLEKFSFPNSNDPYGHWYRTTADSASAIVPTIWWGEQIVGDLLPFGGAFAKASTSMWDADAPSSVWADTGTDSDYDGMPDWWELLHGTDPNDGEGINGWYGDWDGDGTPNGEQYLRDLAHGWREGDTTVPTGPMQTADIDQDGLPDWWENIYNLKVEIELGSEAATASIHGAMGDPDRDGLNNLAEYLISEVYTNFQVRLNPRKIKSTASQTMSDYFLKAGLVYFGELFTDHDFMEYSWELNFPPEYVNPFVYDAHLDPDQDGWSNWAESRYGASALRSDPSLVEHLNPDGTVVKDYPVPMIATKFAYHGIRPLGDLIVHAFSDPSMNGNPDAIFVLPAPTPGNALSFTKSLGFWGPKKVQGVLSPGSVVPSTIVITFTDQTPSPASAGNGGNWDTSLRMIQAVIDVGDPNQAGRSGLLQARNAAGQVSDIGTINYLTGEYTMDLELLADWRLQSREYDRYGDLVRPELDVDGAYITISYDSNLIAGWPKTLYLSDAEVPTAANPSLGHVKEGMNYFFAFIDLNSNKSWDAGEPCAVDSGFGVDIGYDRNTVMFELTDYTPGYLRMMLTGQRSEDVIFGGGSSGGGQSSGGPLANWVIVKRTGFSNGTAGQRDILVKRLLSSRNSLHEGDFLAEGQFALDWGFPGINSVSHGELETITYEVYVGPSTNTAECVMVTAFTNRFAKTTLKKAITVSPINGGYVYSARPTFKWQMPQGFDDDDYQAFIVELKQGGTSGDTVYRSGPIKAPLRDINGVYTWEAPIYANSRLPENSALPERTFDSNKVYAWRVIALNSKFDSYTNAPTAGWSDWKLFRLDVNQDRNTSGGFGAIQARVKYYGPAQALLENRVRVQAFNNAAFSGTPVSEYTLTGTDMSALTDLNAPVVNGRVSGLPDSGVVGDYYVMAFIDHNRNGKRDIWESWGYVNYYGVSDKPYDPRSVSVAQAAPPPVVDIVIEDADTDQDWFPDAWEWQEAERANYTPMSDFLARVGPSSGTRPDEEINPDLLVGGRQFASIMWFAADTTDSDGDGLSDWDEMMLGGNSSSASTANDGYLDGDKYLLGLNPADWLGLRLTGVDVAAGVTPQLDVAVEVRKSAFSLQSATPPKVAAYEVIYAPSLAIPLPQWTVVGRGTVTLDGVQTVTKQLEGVVPDSASGFFRVRLVP